MTQSLHEALRTFDPALPLGVALSGGADSTALLALCARKWPGKVVALHINHGLQAAARDFHAHCVQLCDALQVPLRVKSVNAFNAPGQSPEDAARIARYQGLVELAGDGTPLQTIAVAQHADDQVETLLLALGRGAGLAGMSAMPSHWVREGIDFYRPLLDVPGEVIRAWLAQEQIPFVVDPTNADERYTRNRIRLNVLPALQAVFPSFRETFARSARNAAQAQELLDEMAALDLQQVLRERDGRPSIQALQRLTEARQANVLRHWLKTRFGVIPAAAQLQELQSQIAACTTRGHRIHIKVGIGFVERKWEVLDWYNPKVLPYSN
jgi:tRNA(Ile)-lysidine synthase